jgi:hypothetical protein
VLLHHPVPFLLPPDHLLQQLLKCDAVLVVLQGWLPLPLH